MTFEGGYDVPFDRVRPCTPMRKEKEARIMALCLLNLVFHEIKTDT